MRYSFLLVPFMFLLAACAHASEEEDMSTLAAQLTKLSTYVEDTAEYVANAEKMPSKELLSISVAHDKRIMEAFEGYILKAIIKDKKGVVLICTKNGKNSLLEDAGCSMILDRHHWKETPKPACEFTLSAAQICLK